MRIAGTSYTDSMVSQLNLLSTQQYQLQNQASTGQTISAPSDDPAGMALALNLQADNSAVTQYAQNISTLQNRATIAGNALSSLQTIEERASEIATSADGASSPAQLQANASEVTQLIQQAAQLMNTQDGSQYVFGGTASGSAPFTVSTDASGNVTAVTYSGNADVAQRRSGAKRDDGCGRAGREQFRFRRARRGKRQPLWRGFVQSPDFAPEQFVVRQHRRHHGHGREKSVQ